MGGEFFATFGGLLVILALFGLGALIIALAYNNIKKGRESLSWPTTEGVVTKSWVDVTKRTDDDGDVSHFYSPTWEYQYTIAGQSFTCNRDSYGSVPNYSSKKRAEGELDQRPLHSKVVVYYNPYDPTDSVLTPGARGAIVWILIAAIPIVLAVIFAVRGATAFVTGL